MLVGSSHKVLATENQLGLLLIRGADFKINYGYDHNEYETSQHRDFIETTNENFQVIK